MAYPTESMPLVSIIIPTYNYADLIVETLMSVLQQSYQNWECIIIDDESGDQTTQVVNDFIAAHPAFRFTYLRVKNGGTSAAKNTGIELAKGEYIQFLDADDLLSPDKLAIQVKVAQQQDANLVFSKSLFFKGDAQSPIYINKYPPGFLAIATLAGHELDQRLIHNNILTISSPLVKRSLVIAAGKFDAHLRNNEDWLFWFKIARIYPRFVFDGDDAAFALIRVHGHSAMSNHQNMFNGEIVVRKYMNEILSDQEDHSERQELLRLNSDLLALHHIRSMNITQGFSHILSSFVKNPIRTVPLLGMALFRLGTRLYKSIR